LNTTGDRISGKEDAMSESNLQTQTATAKAYQEAERVLGAYVTATGTTACEIAAHLVTGTRS
jgi:hypothetical protein